MMILIILSIQNTSMTQDCVIIADVGGDIDDVLTLVLATKIKHLNIVGVIASSFFTDIRAKIAKLLLKQLGRADIKVYRGFDDISNFSKYDPLYPPSFDSVNDNNKNNNNNFWFTNFGLAYKDFYGQHIFDRTMYEDEPAVEFLNRILEIDYSNDNRLTIVCTGPMHDLDLIEPDLLNHIDLYCMGGGFEETNRVGYNWGICPYITQSVLNKIKLSRFASLTVISSSLVRDTNFVVPHHLFETWSSKLLSGNMLKPAAILVMTDWLYCDKLNRARLLADPLTLYSAVFHDYHYKTGDYQLQLTDMGSKNNYNQISIFVDYNPNSNCRIVTDFDSSFLAVMLAELNDFFK
jgi:hypothetical protein